MKKLTSLCFCIFFFMLSSFACAFKAPTIRANDTSDPNNYLELSHDGTNPAIKTTYGNILFQDPNGVLTSSASKP